VTTARGSQLAAVLAILIGLLALLGWWLDNPVLYSTLTGLPSMKPATAVLVMLTGAGLLLISAEPTGMQRGAAFACALAVVLGSIAFLADSSIGQQPAPATLVVVLALGLALLLLQVPRPPVLA